MPTLKEKVENNVVIWLLGALLSGFLAGIGTYESALRMFKFKTISSERLALLENGGGDTKAPQDIYSVPLPGYLGKSEIELLFSKVKTAYNNQNNDALYDLIGPIGRAQVSGAAAEQSLKHLHENLGKIKDGFYVQHQFSGKLGLYTHFALNFSVEYENAEKGLATVTIIDDGESYQVYGIFFNKL